MMGGDAEVNASGWIKTKTLQTSQNLLGVYHDMIQELSKDSGWQDCSEVVTQGVVRHMI